MNDSKEFFLKEKPVKALMVLDKSQETYCSEVSEKIDSTYAHTIKIISRMEELGLLETKKSGRKKLIQLSEEGEEQANLFKQLMKYYGDYNNGEGKGLSNQGVFSK